MAGESVSIRMSPSANADVAVIADKWLAKAAIQVQAEAKRLCPVDTGYLRASIQMQHRSDGWYVGSDVVYAGPIEYGHSKQAPQGFLRPALDHVMSKLSAL